MRLTNASLFGLLVAVAPLGTIAQGTLPTAKAEACALLANRTPEQFASNLADLENQAKLDTTRDQAEVDEVLAQVQSLPTENLQAEVDKVCAAQGQMPTINRRRIARRQDIGGTVGGVTDKLPAGLGDTVKGLLDGAAKGGNVLSRRQGLGGLTGALGGVTGGGKGGKDGKDGKKGGLLGGMLLPGVL